MMKFFVSNHVVLFILVVTTTIDASRIFYLPLPKIHSSHENPPAAKSDESIPASELEREELEKRGDAFDWEALVDREAAAAAKHRIIVNELLPESLRHLVEERENDLAASVHKPQLNHEEEPWVSEKAYERVERLQSNAAVVDKRKQVNGAILLFIVGTCCAVGVVGLLGAAVFWYKVKKRAASAEDSEYPSYGVTGPNSSGGKISPSSTMSDRKLAQSAQMFHYQQQRQQMMAQEKAHLDAKPVNSDDSDDETQGGGDYTVYECPGLAPTGEMEVRNPLFAEPDSSLTSPGATSTTTTTNNHYPQLSTSPTKEKSLP